MTPEIQLAILGIVTAALQAISMFVLSSLDRRVSVLEKIQMEHGGDHESFAKHRG